MTDKTFVPPGRLTDGELLARVQRLARHEQHATALLAAHLAELDERRLHIAQGYSSLFTYCTGALRMTEDAAFARIRTARAGRRFPLVLEKLLSGEVSLTAVKILAPHLTAENHREVLRRMPGLGLHGLKKLIAEISPRPDVAPSVRALPRRSTPMPVAMIALDFSDPAGERPAAVPEVGPVAMPVPR